MAQTLYVIGNVFSTVLFVAMLFGIAVLIAAGRARKRHPLLITVQCIAIFVSVIALHLIPFVNIFYTAPTIDDAMVLHGESDYRILGIHETHDLAIVLHEGDEGENWWVFFPKTEDGRYKQPFIFNTEIGMKHDDDNGLLISWFTYEGTETCYIEAERFGSGYLPIDPAKLTDSYGSTFETERFEVSEFAADVSDGIRYTLLLDDYNDGYAVIYDGESYELENRVFSSCR